MEEGQATGEGGRAYLCVPSQWQEGVSKERLERASRHGLMFMKIQKRGPHREKERERERGRREQGGAEGKDAIWDLAFDSTYFMFVDNSRGLPW